MAELKKETQIYHNMSLKVIKKQVVMAYII